MPVFSAWSEVKWLNPCDVSRCPLFERSCFQRTAPIRARAAARGVSFDEAMAQFVAPISLRRMVSAQEIADVALFLATPAGRSISGQAVSVCGDHGYLA
jgi:enoyl-[acyl-carrier-protein] reductase (NADH)